jgi:glycerophosphoryl diester phosphodiesterase
MVKRFGSILGDEPVEARPLVIAHRGASGLAPENTPTAFELAIMLGADGLELDVQLSADHKPVVIHDSLVNRTTNAVGKVADFTAEDLSRLDASSWFERRLAVRPRTRDLARRAAAASGRNGLEFGRQPVPSLESVLTLAAGANLKRLYVELKSSRARREALLEASLSVIQNSGVEELVTILSFDHEILKQVSEAAPGIRTAATFPAASSLATLRSIARAAGAAQVDECALHYGLVSKRAVDFLHDRGFAVSVWTANSRIVMRRLISCGVDAIMTNFPERLVSAFEMKETLRSRLRRRRLRGARSGQ